MIDEPGLFTVDLRRERKREVVNTGDWHDGPMLAGCRSVCWGLCVSFDQMPMGCWTCVEVEVVDGGLHIWGSYGWWWICGILDGWACVTSLSCEGLKYITPLQHSEWCIDRAMGDSWESFTTLVTQQSTVGRVDRTTETSTKGQSRSVSAAACT